MNPSDLQIKRPDKNLFISLRDREELHFYLRVKRVS